jgi:murein DD-endopeptidase MepM/ murein hydrolase activator NlpD
MNRNLHRIVLNAACLIASGLSACDASPKQALAGGALPSVEDRGGSAVTVRPLGPLASSSTASPQPKPPPPPRSSSTSTPGRSFVRPATGPIIKAFDGKTSKGIDFGGKRGDPVVAAAAGHVSYAGSALRGYGQLLILSHGTDLISVYAHNSELLVKEGAAVAQGQLIARMGATDAGRVALHFEIRKRGITLDPRRLLVGCERPVACEPSLAGQSSPTQAQAGKPGPRRSSQ